MWGKNVGGQKKSLDACVSGGKGGGGCGGEAMGRRGGLGGRDGGCGAGTPGEGKGLGLNLERQGGLKVILEIK